MSIFDNGGFIGRIADYTDTSRYILGGIQNSPVSPSFVGATGLIQGDTITLPTELEPGDLVIVATTSDNAATTIPTGYTSGQRGTVNSVNYQWSYKVMADPVDISAGGLLNNARACHIAIAFRGVDPDNIFDVASPTITTFTSGMPNPPAITTVTDKTTIIALGFLDDDRVAAAVVPPSGYTLAIASQSRLAGATMMAAYKELSSTATEDPGAFSATGGNDSWVGATIALKADSGTELILGNQKNSGIWSLSTVWATKTALAGITVVGYYNSPGSAFDYGTELTDLQVGDVLFLTAAASFGLYDYDGGPNDPRPLPVRDSEFVTVTVVDGALSYYVCYKVLTAENISTTTANTGNSQAYAQVIQVRGLDLNQLESFSDGFQDRLLYTDIRTISSGTGAVDPPSITASASGSLILVINVVQGTLSMTAPAEYILIDSYSYNSGVARSISSGYKSNTTGTQDPGSFSSNPSNIANASITFALAPFTDEGESPSGQEVFTTSGSFIVPIDVTSVSAVVVAAGGGGGGSGDTDETGGGGGGGGLAYATFAVTPGETLTVTVGTGGSGGGADDNGGAGSASSIARSGTPLVAANGGSGGTHRGAGGAGGAVTTGTGGTGGVGGAGSNRASNNAGGGGGAGGYSGNGGSGGSAASTGSATAGSGGGGGGGGGGTNNSTRGGGGVGILGEGVSGARGAANVSGSGGSGGSVGTNTGGSYGGGGRGAAGAEVSGSAGAPGAARIIWGTGRAYPSTSTADV